MYPSSLVAGVDEAGRGPLAGPVIAAAVILPIDLDVTDSKKLTPKRREALFKEIMSDARIEVGVGIVEEKRIDEINILAATMEAMQIAVGALNVRPESCLIDGNKVPELEMPAEAIVKGDAKVKSIGAASIVAKVLRDRLMLGYHEKYPEYGFDKHMGYGTKKHLEALSQFGPCPIHRMTFAPVRNLSAHTGEQKSSAHHVS